MPTRDIGNAAKMREALKTMVWWFEYAQKAGALRWLIDEDKACRVLDLAKAALAATPRNCDIYTRDDEADREFEVFCESRERFDSCGTCPHNKNGVRCRVSWLLAPATPGE